MKRVEKSMPKVPLFKVKSGASFEERCIAYCKKYTLYYHVHQDQYHRYDEKHNIEEFITKPTVTKNPTILNSKYELPGERIVTDFLINDDIILNKRQDYGELNFEQSELFTDEMNFYNFETDDSQIKTNDDFTAFINEEDKF